MTTEGEAMKRESIKISDYWAEQLDELPYISCKFSKMSSRILILKLVDSKMLSSLLIHLFIT